MQQNITKKIKKDNFFKLLKRLIKKFGFPLVYEELTIYLEDAHNSVKIIIKTNFGIEVIYRDKNKRILSTFTTKSEDIKNIIYVLSKTFGDTGWISISPVFHFTDKQKSESIKLIEKSLIGSIITFINKKDKIKFNNFFGEKLFEINNRKTKPKENIMDYSVSKNGILNTKILSYLERNGIFVIQNKKITYRDILNNRSNNYQIYENLFYIVTNHKLLEKKSLTTKNNILKNTKASIIIPCYNSEKTILKVLDSIKKQKMSLSFSDLEVILIDDASNKNISSLVNTSKFPFSIQIIRLNNNSGSSMARHVGTTFAQGEILIFIDSDILLPKNYLQEHLLRNTIINNAIFVSFKENVKENNSLIKNINNLKIPDYSKDLRINKVVKKDAIGSYCVDKEKEIEILESTNYFKSFYGSKIFGVYDLSCMVIGHNFSVRKRTLLDALPFNRSFIGWGMEDVYLGLKLICKGNFVIPVLSTGVYHIDHPPRSGSEQKKTKEYKQNTNKINSFLDSEVKLD